MAGPFSPEAFKELASADCTVELATRAVETLHGIIPLLMWRRQGTKRVACEVALMRVKGELRTVADSASGKRVPPTGGPPAKVKTKFPTRSAARFGGSLTNNLLVDSSMLAAILLDPGVYRSLRIP
ncbi:hypothetical protein FOZ62_013795, partial [Perkinsus olseni]